MKIHPKVKTSSRKRESANGDIVRCAIYARCASSDGGSGSIERQIRIRKAYAEKRGWEVVKEFIKADVAVSGATLKGRNALLNLIKISEQRPRLFDRVLSEDTSRLSRNLGDTLWLVGRFESNGIHVISVSAELDLSDYSARQLLVSHGLMDEQYLTALCEKIHHGQKVRVLKGYVAGGKCYGYRNLPVEGSTRKSLHLRPLVRGGRLEIAPKQAEIVRSGMYSVGQSLSAIAEILNAKRIPSPSGKASRNCPWRPTTLKAILRNERYRALIIWNRTQKTRDTETGRTKTRPRPKQEWVQVQAPELRIISDEIWKQVQAKRRQKQGPRLYLGAVPRRRRGAKS